MSREITPPTLPGLHSRFAYCIIGEDGWNLELFRKVHEISLTINIALWFFGTQPDRRLSL